MPLKKSVTKASRRTRADGRRQLLVYLNPNLIKQLKKAALDEETTAYEITEEALRKRLAARKRKPKTYDVK